jgi:hypothetical protein
MKTVITTVALLVASTFFITINAQTWGVNYNGLEYTHYPQPLSSALLGIGTDNADPNFRLHIFDNVKGGIFLQSNASSGIRAIKIKYQGFEKSFINNSGEASFLGSVRIGHYDQGGAPLMYAANTFNPDFKLQVDGLTFSNKLASLQLMLGGYQSWLYTGSERLYVNGTSRFTGASQFDGAVSIGTVTTTCFPTYRLFVEGGIMAEKVKVALPGGGFWCDYVFNQDYKLMSIAELKIYLEKNKHLPHIPSASNLEENGVDLLEANRDLLKSVEELTLYIIQLQEQIDDIKKSIK